MDNFVLHIKTKVVFGKGEFDHLSQYAKTLGKKALVVTGKRFAKESGLLDKALKQLEDSGIEAVVFSEVEPNPESDTVDRGGKLARENHADFVIAIGGGSVIDAAKMIKVVAVTERPCWDYFERPPKAIIDKPTLPLLTAVTVAATGSELDNGAVIVNTQTRDKRGFFDNNIYPSISIVDPLLTLSTPKKQTADGVVDMFIHIFESYLSSKANAPVSDRISEALLKECMKQGRIVINDLQNVEARENLSWISSLALSGIPNAGRKGPHTMHRLEHPLSGQFHISHGRGLSAIMPAYLVYTYDIYKDRLETFGEMVFGKKDAKNTIFEINNWLKELEAFNGLKDLGVDKNSFTALAEAAIREDGSPNFVNAKRPLYKDEVIKIYELAYDYTNFEEKINELS